MYRTHLAQRITLPREVTRSVEATHLCLSMFRNAATKLFDDHNDTHQYTHKE
jgi:hypothetical protein